MSLLELAPRETALEAGGYVKGLAIGVVTHNADKAHPGEVRVRFPWHKAHDQSAWARVATPMAGPGRGLFLLPEVGDEVLCGFERENMTSPVVLGALWNGKDKRPDANADGRNDRRGLRSRKGHLLLFDDGAKGRVELSLSTAAGSATPPDNKRRVVIDDDEVRIEDEAGNSIAIATKGGGITIAAKAKLTLKAPAISIQADGKLDLSGSGTVSVKGGLVTIN